MLWDFPITSALREGGIIFFVNSSWSTEAVVVKSLEHFYLHRALNFSSVGDLMVVVEKTFSTVAL